MVDGSMILRVLRLLAPLLLFASVVRAQQAAPPAVTIRPATAPTTARAVDQATPIGALKLLTQAMEIGDEKTMRSVLQAKTPAEEKMLSAMIGLAEAQHHLHQSAVTTFGEQGAKGLTGDTATELSQALAQLDTASEQINKDGTATVAVTGQEGPPLTLAKSDAKWRLPLSSLSHGINPDSLSQRLTELAAQTDVIHRTAADITAGKYHTAEDAAETLHSRMMATAMERAAAAHIPPATQHSTAPPAR
jgi:hypothetical protein